MQLLTDVHNARCIIEVKLRIGEVQPSDARIQLASNVYFQQFILIRQLSWHDVFILTSSWILDSEPIESPSP